MGNWNSDRCFKVMNVQQIHLERLLSVKFMVNILVSSAFKLTHNFYNILQNKLFVRIIFLKYIYLDIFKRKIETLYNFRKVVIRIE